MKNDAKKLNWIKAQKREREFYRMRARSISDNYLEIHRDYWRKILNLIPETNINSTDTVIDIGCGPTTILTEITCDNKIGVDPLVDFYKKRFKLPNEVTYIKEKVENLDKKLKVKVNHIFAMNSIDHIEDTSAISKLFYTMLADDGSLIVLMNVAKHKLLGEIIGAIGGYRILDPTHPYHYHSPKIVTQIFTDHFTVLKIIDVTDLRTQQSQIVHSNMEHKKVNLIKRFYFAVYNYINSHDTYLFVFRKK